jgi:hypothetical protein
VAASRRWARTRLTALRQLLTAFREATRRSHASGLSHSRTVAQRSQAFRYASATASSASARSPVIAYTCPSTRRDDAA